jgi:hypothetical protein
VVAHPQTPAGAFRVVVTTVTTLQGKHDTLTILVAVVPDAVLTLSPEIAEARWVKDLHELGAVPLSKWLLRALVE